MIFNGFLITEHAANCFGVSNVHGVTLHNFATLEEAVEAAGNYRLAEMSLIPDEDEIDLSDIPEVTDWSKAVRGKFYRPQS